MTVTHVPPQMPAKTPCRLAFLGEAPGSEEIVGGKPLIGPSGRVFNAILRSANIDREQCLVTNVFDQKAPDNEVGPWMKDPIRVNEAAERLAGEFAAAQPTVIVPMGATALWALTGWTQISSFRGAALRATRIVPGAKLLPTFHPAAVMRMWKMLPLVTGDFIKAVAEAELGPQIVHPHVELLVAPTIEEVEAFEAECLAADLLSTDIETAFGQITCIGFGVSAQRAMTIPFVDFRKPNRSYWATPQTEARAWRMVERVLRSPVPKLGQNFTYDAFWILEGTGMPVMNYLHDTRLLSHALYPELPKDLATLGANYTRLGPWKTFGGRFQSEKRDA